MRKRKSFSQHLHLIKKDVFTLMDHIEAAVHPVENSKLSNILKAYREKLDTKCGELEENYKHNVSELQSTIVQKNQQIKELVREKDTIVSDNYLLEYKKKDLMLLADQLEEANEEISKKNVELAAQKKQIQEQARKINKVNQKILKKNEEMEQQKEFILDQADYLQDANEMLLKMNKEVEKQKAQIQKKNEELIALNTEKNNLIHIIAHDLKSPLNQIQGLISLIKYNPDKLSDDSVKCLEMMNNSANRLNEMIAKILDVKAIEAQTLNLKIERINLSVLLKECAQRYSLTASNKRIKLLEDIETEIFAEVDKDFTTQTMENLLSNAIKFSQSNTSIQLKLFEKEGSALIEVSDQGPGINMEDKKKLFQKFQKLTAQPTGNETSTGLGLSIVKKFVEAMGGEIWCESEAGQGATFYVKLATLNGTVSALAKQSI